MPGDPIYSSRPRCGLDDPLQEVGFPMRVALRIHENQGVRLPLNRALTVFRQQRAGQRSQRNGPGTLLAFRRLELSLEDRFSDVTPTMQVDAVSRIDAALGTN